MRVRINEYLLLVLTVIIALVCGVLATVIPPLMLALAVFAPVFAIVFLTNLRMALLALLVMRSSIDTLHETRIASVGDFELNLAAIMAIALIGLGFYYILANSVNIFGSPSAIPYAVFLAVGIAGLLVTRYPSQTISDWLRLASVYMFYILLVDVFRSERDIVKIIVAYFLSSVVPVLTGLYQLITHQGVYVDGFERIYATFTVPPIFAFYLVGLLALMIVVFVHLRDKLLKSLVGVWLALITVNLFATYTRGAWIGAAIVLTVLALLRYRKLLILMPLIAIAIVTVFPQAIERFEDLSSSTSRNGYDEANTFAWRTKFWVEEVLATNEGSPLVGAGIGAIKRKYWVDPHNDYLRLYVEMGLLGVISYLLVIVILFIRGLKAYMIGLQPWHRDLSLAFVSVLLAYATMSIADNIILGPVLQWYFWTQAAVVHIIAESALGWRWHKATNSITSKPRAWIKEAPI